MNDPYDTGIPKYSTASSIYDGLCELVQSEEMGILGEMFADVSWDGQDYYYTDAGYKLKEQFDELSDWGNKLWLMDLAVWQLDQTEIHDLVYEALMNADLAKRIGFKKLFVENMLRGDKSDYDEIAEAYADELAELDRFDFMDMLRAFDRVMEERGQKPIISPYSNFCHAICDKLRNLQLHKETQLIAECRALLTSHDDFIFGLRANQHLYTQLEQSYQNKVHQLQARYDEKVKQLFAIAEKQGISLPELEDVKMLPDNDSDPTNTIETEGRISQ